MIFEQQRDHVLGPGPFRRERHFSEFGCRHSLILNAAAIGRNGGIPDFSPGLKQAVAFVAKIGDGNGDNEDGGGGSLIKDGVKDLQASLKKLPGRARF